MRLGPKWKIMQQWPGSDVGEKDLINLHANKIFRLRSIFRCITGQPRYR